MLSKEFSKDILAGLRKDGWTLREIGDMTDLRQSELKLIREARAAFKHSHARKIEQTTRLSVGQLAAKLFTRASDKPFRDLMDAWATMLEYDLPSRKRTVNRS